MRPRSINSIRLGNIQMTVNCFDDRSNPGQTVVDPTVHRSGDSGHTGDLIEISSIVTLESPVLTRRCRVQNIHTYIHTRLFNIAAKRLDKKIKINKIVDKCSKHTVKTILISAGARS
jgi:hypothetical protein